MSFDKEWQVEATINIFTSIFAETKEEAEKEARAYLSEMCQGLYPDCCDYEIESIYSYTDDESEESEG